MIWRTAAYDRWPTTGQHALARTPGERCFPNRVGNTWRYEWRDGDGKLLLHEFWRMAAKRGKLAHLGFSAVELK